MGKRYAVLGGGGSFGIHTSKYLLEQPDTDRVIGIGRNGPKTAPFTLGVGDDDERYSYHAYHVNYELDLLLEFLDKEKPETIVNYAAQGESAVSFQNSWRYFETNAMALTRLCEALGKREWLKRFIHIGTSELYGSVDEPAKEDSPIIPSSPYAASKAAFDLQLILIHKMLDFPMNIIRPSNAYSPGQLLHRVVPKAVVCSLKGEKLPLHGGGVVKRSYMHIHDLARAIHLISEAAPLGKVYNAGPPETITIRGLMEGTADALGIPFEDLCEVAEDRFGQDDCYWIDSSEIFRDLGWKVEVSHKEGLADMVAWGRKYFDQLKDWPMSYTFRA